MTNDSVEYEITNIEKSYDQIKEFEPMFNPRDFMGFERTFYSELNKIAIFRINGENVAYINYTHENVFWIANIAIKPRFRNRRVFNAVRQFIMDNRNGKQIECCIFENDDRIRTFVRKHGFVSHECPWRHRKEDCSWFDRCQWKFYRYEGESARPTKDNA